MRILEPKEGQKYLYFYDDYDLNPSQDITTVKNHLREIGCKIGPVWNRKEPAYYLCSCEKGDFRLVNDVPAIYIDAEDSQVIETLAIGLIRVCHTYKIGEDVRLRDGKSAMITDYSGENYIISLNNGEKIVSENDIVCKKLIPDDVLGKKVKISVRFPDFGDFDEYEGTVEAVYMSDINMCLTLKIIYDADFDDSEEPYTASQTFFENELTCLDILQTD